MRLQQAMAELDLAALLHRYLPELFGRLAQLGASPAGAPYVRYHEFGPEQVDVEIGIPIREPLGGVAVGDSGPGDVGASELPGGEAALLVHVAPYEGLPQSYERLSGWIEGQGRTAGAGPWESYVDDPSEVAMADVRTEIRWPLA